MLVDEDGRLFSIVLIGSEAIQVEGQILSVTESDSVGHSDVDAGTDDGRRGNSEPAPALLVVRVRLIAEGVQLDFERKRDGRLAEVGLVGAFFGVVTALVRQVVRTGLAAWSTVTICIHSKPINTKPRTMNASDLSYTPGTMIHRICGVCSTRRR